MTLTNILNLPQPLAQAVAQDDYDPGPCNVTITQLLDPPRKVELFRRHGSEITEDVSDRIWALMGRSIHKILEQTADQDSLREERLFIEVLGWTISGKFDRLTLDAGVLSDWKMSSVWEIILGVKIQREQQLNCYAHLARAAGHTIKSLEAIFLLRDWQKSKAAHDRTYPQAQVAREQVALWTPERCQEFLETRVRALQSAQTDLPLCTDEERWKKRDQFAVMKAGRKTALRVLDSQAEALDWAKEKGLQDGYGRLLPGTTLEPRPGEPTRCIHYCAVAEFCDQFQREVREEGLQVV